MSFFIAALLALSAFLFGCAFALHPQTRPLPRSFDQARDIAMGAWSIGVSLLIAAAVIYFVK